MTRSMTYEDYHKVDLEQAEREKLKDMFRKFDAFFQGGVWEHPCARKVHIDLFGDIIYEGENYYKRRDWRFTNVDVNLSEKSMFLICSVLFEGNPRMEELGGYLLEQRMEEMKDTVRRMDRRNRKRSKGEPQDD